MIVFLPLSPQILLVAAVSSFFVLLLLGLYHHAQKHSRSHGKACYVCRDIKEARGILKRPFLDDILPLLASRAVPNKRLVRAFDIENSFTTTDEDWHRQFRQKVAERLNLSSQEWQALGLWARETMRHTTESGKDGKVDLRRLIQVFTMKIVLRNFFPEENSTTSEETKDQLAETIAEKINDLWIQSKHSEISEMDRRSLTEACRKLLPNIDMTSPRDNPLNIILPAYETLWRIVFLCFIEVRFRSKHNDRYLFQELLKSYLREPTQQALHKKEDNISVSCIVNEALRLYPPTKRINRLSKRSPEAEPEMVGVDVEFFHRDTSVWGADATIFRPGRWSKASAKNQFMPFGAKPFLCPAERVFGPRMIGVLVAALTEGFGDGWLLEGSEIPKDGPMRNDREGFNGIFLRFAKEKEISELC